MMVKTTQMNTHIQMHRLTYAIETELERGPDRYCRTAPHVLIQDETVTDYWRTEAKMCSQSEQNLSADLTDTAVQLLTCAHTRRTSD